MDKTPLYLVTVFLGSGKTTLLKKIMLGNNFNLSGFSRDFRTLTY